MSPRFHAKIHTYPCSTTRGNAICGWSARFFIRHLPFPSPSPSSLCTRPLSSPRSWLISSSVESCRKNGKRPFPISNPVWAITFRSFHIYIYFLRKKREENVVFRIEEKKKFKFRFYLNAVASWFDFFLLRTGYLSSAKGTVHLWFPIFQQRSQRSFETYYCHSFETSFYSVHLPLQACSSISDRWKW